MALRDSDGFKFTLWFISGFKISIKLLNSGALLGITLNQFNVEYTVLTAEILIEFYLVLCIDNGIHIEKSRRKGKRESHFWIQDMVVECL